MNELQNKAQALITKYKLQPNLVNYGQHFLIDQASIKLFINTCGLSSEDLVLEIGPGLGFITEDLVKRVKQVTAVEIDLSLKPVLENLQTKYANLNLVWQNVLSYKHFDYDLICGALAYNIFEPLLRQLVFQTQFKQAVFIVSKKFSDDLIAKNNLTTLLAMAFYEVQITKILPKELFYPQPQYPGALIKLIPKEKLDKTNYILKQIFQQKNRRLKKSIRIALLNWLEFQQQPLTEFEAREKVKEVITIKNLNQSIFQLNKLDLMLLVDQIKKL